MRHAEKVVFYDGELGRCAVEFFRGSAYMHLRMKAWSLDAMRVARVIGPEILAVLQRLRCKHIFAYNREEAGSDMWLRFMVSFGFKEVARKNGIIFTEAGNV